ncbi:hypothetical protein FACS1894139_18480 [Planctomycetales bacterium]|nr:hypothetical protein FACS1894107_11070 [Planctomycetales bacterium]GHS99482.1 hypothetical protein FACS1894108_09550 [Planctomycetales bacterium]GHT08609.1 hypothetical protein FACS1894139_18480 [Planctomycetales bacterium]
MRFLIIIAFALPVLALGLLGVVCQRTGALTAWLGEATAPLSVGTVAPEDLDYLFHQAVPESVRREQEIRGFGGRTAGERAVASLPAPPPFVHTFADDGASPKIIWQDGDTLYYDEAQPTPAAKPSRMIPQSRRRDAPAAFAAASASAPVLGADCPECGVLAAPSGNSVEFAYPAARDGEISDPAKVKNDDLYKLLLQPTNKKQSYLDLALKLDYRKVKEAPSSATGMPARISTEAMVAQMLDWSNYLAPRPQLAMGKKPAGDEALNPTIYHGLKFHLTPYYLRTDFGAAYKLPSSKWDEYGVSLGAGYYHNRFSFVFTMPLEYNSFDGQIRRDCFFRVANIFTGRIDILSETFGDALDLYAGLDGFYDWIFGDTAYMKDTFQYGAGAFLGARKNLRYVIPAFFASLQSTLNKPSDYRLTDPAMIGQVPLDAAGKTPFPLDAEQTLLSLNLAVGVPIGQKMLLTPGFYYHNALGSKRRENTTWSEYRVDFSLAMNPDTVVNVRLGAEGDPLKTWHLGGGLDLRVKF